MKKTFALLFGMFLAVAGMTTLASPASATDTTIVKYGTTFTYHGSGSWTVKNTDNSNELKNIGNPQSFLCSHNNVGPGVTTCVNGGSYNTTSNETNGGLNCIYIQGDGGNHGSWDTVPGDSSKNVCAAEPSLPDPTTKPVTLCHFDGGVGTRITVTAVVWYNTHKPHANDIWDAFTYKNVDGTTITVPKQGDTDLLQFSNCKPPVQDIKVVPTTTQVDKCGTANDEVKLVPGTGYAGGVTNSGLVYTVTANTTAGFVFDASQMSGWTLSNSNTTAVKTVTLTNSDCGLPDTGGAATHNTKLGLIALGGLVIVVAGGLLVARKRS